jgi:hypothetical protein
MSISRLDALTGHKTLNMIVEIKSNEDLLGVCCSVVS